MAYDSVLQGVTLSIEVANGNDTAGNPVFRKRNYSGVKSTATAEQIGAVAKAIKDVISKESRDTYKNSVEKIKETV